MALRDWSRGTALLLGLVFLLGACGDDKKKKDSVFVPADGGTEDAGPMDAGLPDEPDAKTPAAPLPPRKPVQEIDSGMDAAPPIINDPNPFEAPPVPDAWECPDSFWDDAICDCGCGARDADCLQLACAEPGCFEITCDVCYTTQGSWKPCEADPDPDDWLCAPALRSDGQCDCGCGVPDPDCQGKGCTTPLCRTSDCDRRHDGTALLADGGIPPALQTNPPELIFDWTCAWGAFGSGDGCDCGCGAEDPDCAGGGCEAGSCFTAECRTCHDSDGRPMSCDAAAAGWTCNATHFDANDGCDCGCGGPDPDCGNDGCTVAGCSEDACDLCTTPAGQVVGCNVPLTWTDNACKPEDYGTGNGCDCGCGVRDPDCASDEGCTNPGCTNATCDVCNDGVGFFVQCKGWTCTNPDAFGTAECDCGCGVVDPFCRDTGRVSCTGDTCERAACEFCNPGDVRGTCGGQWQSSDEGSSCGLATYGLDGLCDCGCGFKDPDCGPGEGCTERGCTAPGCDVCRDGTIQVVCQEWTCDPDLQGSGAKCNCGCGAPDPDCGNGGCTEPGCADVACEACHDPFGRKVPCP